MNSIARSLGYALGNVLHPRMLWLMVWPLVLALGLWGTLAIVFWAQIALAIAEWLQAGLAYAPFISQWDLTDATLLVAKLLVLLMLVPLVQLTAVMILSIFGLPAMVEYVAARSFPALERRRGGSLAGSVWNGLVALAGMLGLGLASIPLWIFPPLWPLIPLAILRLYARTDRALSLGAGAFARLAGAVLPTLLAGLAGVGCLWGWQRWVAPAAAPLIRDFIPGPSAAFTTSVSAGPPRTAPTVRSSRCGMRSRPTSRWTIWTFASDARSRSANWAVSASGTPDGVALVRATIATSADGRMTKFVPAPSSNAPEWLSCVRAADVVPTLNPKP